MKNHGIVPGTQLANACTLNASLISGCGDEDGHYDSATNPIEFAFDQCIGGKGDHCDDGVLSYSATGPGSAPEE